MSFGVSNYPDTDASPANFAYFHDAAFPGRIDVHTVRIHVSYEEEPGDEHPGTSTHYRTVERTAMPLDRIRADDVRAGRLHRAARAILPRHELR
jgi:hypothetical protein